MEASRQQRSTAGTVLYMLLGPVLWAAHFTIAYAAHWSLCATGLADIRIIGIGIVPMIITLATLAMLAVLAWASLRPRRAARIFRAGGWENPAQSFHASVMRLLALLSAFGIIAAALSPLMLPVCTGLR